MMAKRGTAAVRLVGCLSMQKHQQEWQHKVPSTQHMWMRGIRLCSNGSNRHNRPVWKVASRIWARWLILYCGH